MKRYPLKNGDVIGFSGSHWHSDSINLLTYGVPRWSISHVGVIAGDTDILWEAISKCGVTVGVPRNVIDVYDGRVWVYPLYRSLYPHESRRLREKLVGAKDVPYDMAGAIRSGGLLFALMESLLWRQDFSSYFCSELVASKLSEIGVFPTTNASRWNPNKYVRRLRREGILRKPVRLK